jgi:hypothetical protein
MPYCDLLDGFEPLIVTLPGLSESQRLCVMLEFNRYFDELQRHSGSAGEWHDGCTSGAQEAIQ